MAWQQLPQTNVYWWSDSELTDYHRRVMRTFYRQWSRIYVCFPAADDPQQQLFCPVLPGSQKNVRVHFDDIDIHLVVCITDGRATRRSQPLSAGHVHDAAYRALQNNGIIVHAAEALRAVNSSPLQQTLWQPRRAPL